MNEILNSWVSMPTGDRILTAVIAVIALLVVMGVGLVFARLAGIDIAIGNLKLFGSKRRQEGAAKKDEDGEADPQVPVLAIPRDTKVRQSLLCHEIFNKREYYENEIEAMNDGSNKALVNVAFLRDCKFASVYKHIIKFAENVEKTKGAELGHLPRVLAHIVKDYGKLSKSVEIRIGDRIVCGVPSSYTRKFDRWHQPHLSMLLDGVNRRLLASYYPDWWARATSCFDLLDFVLELTIEDAKCALSEINGELDKEIKAMFCAEDEAALKG